MSLRILLISTSLTLAACQHTGARVAGPDQADPAAPSATPAAETVAANDNLNAVLWVQTSTEYEALATQTYRAAADHLETALAQANWDALVPDERANAAAAQAEAQRAAVEGQSERGRAQAADGGGDRCCDGVGVRVRLDRRQAAARAGRGAGVAALRRPDAADRRGQGLQTRAAAGCGQAHRVWTLWGVAGTGEAKYERRTGIS